MIRYIILLLLIYIMYRLVRAVFFPKRKSIRYPSGGHSADQAIDEMVKDPVCGVYVPKREALRVSYGGETLYFCSPRCREQYLESKKGSAS
jgi:uncharacterized protein